MLSIFVRRSVIRPIFLTVVGILALMELMLSMLETRLNTTEAQRPNRRIMLRRFRDVRHREGQLLGERVDSDRFFIAMIGTEVRVDRADGEWVLVGRGNALVGRLVRVPGPSECWRIDAPGMGQLDYVMWR